MTTGMTQRMARLRAKMVETRTGLVAVAPGSHMQWLAGFYPHPDERPCLLLVGPEQAAFLMPALNADAARLHSDLPMYPWADADGPDAALASALEAVFPGRDGRIVLDETMRADFAFLVADALPELSRAFTGEHARPAALAQG